MTELLSNIDLIYYCKKFNISLNNCLSKDLFKNITPKTGNYIINLEDSDDGNGSHWVCLILYNDGYSVFFDSFGLSPARDIVKFVKRFNKKSYIIYSTDQIQQYHSIYCGWFCLFFLKFMNTYKKCHNYKYLLNKHNSNYSKENKYINDKIIQQNIKSIINK